jgi:hypothetical protein
MKIRLDFDWVDHPKHDEQVPQLIAIWLEGFGWVKGGSRTGDITIKTEIDVDLGLEQAIKDNNWFTHGVLPVLGDQGPTSYRSNP